MRDGVILMQFNGSTMANTCECRQYSNDYAALEDNLVSFPHQLPLEVQIGRFTLTPR